MGYTFRFCSAGGVDAVESEGLSGDVRSQIRTSLHCKFPVIREFNREFCDFGPSEANAPARNPTAAGTSRIIPYDEEQEISRSISGNSRLTSGSSTLKNCGCGPSGPSFRRMILLHPREIESAPGLSSPLSTAAARARASGPKGRYTASANTNAATLLIAEKAADLIFLAANRT